MYSVIFGFDLQIFSKRDFVKKHVMSTILMSFRKRCFEYSSVTIWLYKDYVHKSILSRPRFIWLKLSNIFILSCLSFNTFFAFQQILWRLFISRHAGYLSGYPCGVPPTNKSVSAPTLFGLGDIGLYTKWCSINAKNKVLQHFFYLCMLLKFKVIYVTVNPNILRQNGSI